MNTSNDTSESYTDPQQPNEVFPLENVKVSAQDIIGLHQTIRSEVDRLDADLKSVRSLPIILIGVFSTFLFLIGSVGWLVIRMQRLETANQNQNVPDLTLQVEAFEKKLEELDQEVSGELRQELQEMQWKLSQMEEQLRTTQVPSPKSSTDSAEPRSPADSSSPQTDVQQPNEVVPETSSTP